MDAYPSNTDASLNARKDEPQTARQDKIVSGSVQVKKESFWRSLKREIISDESRTIGDYVLHDVLVPSFKRTIVDIVCMIFGDSRGGARRASGTGNAARVSYSKYYDEGGNPAPRAQTAKFDYDEIIYDTRGDAELVIQRMYELLDTYGRVTVNDLYDLSGITTPNYQTNKYGWTNLGSPVVKATYNGWSIAYLPKPRPI